MRPTKRRSNNKKVADQASALAHLDRSGALFGSAAARFSADSGGSTRNPRTRSDACTCPSRIQHGLRRCPFRASAPRRLKPSPFRRKAHRQGFHRCPRRAQTRYQHARRTRRGPQQVEPQDHPAQVPGRVPGASSDSSDPIRQSAIGSIPGSRLPARVTADRSGDHAKANT